MHDGVGIPAIIACTFVSLAGGRELQTKATGRRYSSWGFGPSAGYDRNLRQFSCSIRLQVIYRQQAPLDAQWVLSESQNGLLSLLRMPAANRKEGIAGH
jgi:hypothetical protein